MKKYSKHFYFRKFGNFIETIYVLVSYIVTYILLCHAVKGRCRMETKQLNIFKYCKNYDVLLIFVPDKIWLQNELLIIIKIIQIIVIS